MWGEGGRCFFIGLFFDDKVRRYLRSSFSFFLSFRIVFWRVLFIIGFRLGLGRMGLGLGTEVWFGN